MRDSLVVHCKIWSRGWDLTVVCLYYSTIVGSPEHTSPVNGYDDDDDYPESSALDGEPLTHKPEHHTVRFQEEVQVIGLPLRSTTQSRETGE